MNHRTRFVAMAALFILTIILSVVVFGGDGAAAQDDSLTFGAAVELSVAMPLSWLPLISDYTRDAKEPVKATAVSAVVYGLVSCWMYVIGMGAAIFTAESDIAQILVKAGMGIAGLLIVVFSTVTTTFLDAYSAGVSSESLSAKISGKWVAVWTNLVLWLVGWVLYRLLMRVDIPVGNTLPDMAITVVLCVIVNKALKRTKR